MGSVDIGLIYHILSFQKSVVFSKKTQIIRGRLFILTPDSGGRDLTTTFFKWVPVPGENSWETMAPNGKCFVGLILTAVGR